MILLNFLVRYFLVKELGEEIYGIHSFFQNVTNVLLLLEMGLSSAIIIHLYEPVKENDYHCINEILSFYKKTYSGLAFVFFAICLVYGIFVLPINITTTVPKIRLIIFFIIFSLSFTANYLTYYKRSILFADQKNRISIMSTMICEYIFRGLQLVAVIFLHSYIVFLVIIIFEKLFSNVFCIVYVNKHYPYVKNINKTKTSKEVRDKIIKTMKPLFVNQISGTLQNAAPSFIIGLLLGNVSVVGYYANYQLLISSVLLLYSQMGGAFTTSFGNLSVERDKNRMESAFLRTSFITNGIAMIICAVFLSCVQDFISIIFGEGFLLSYYSVLILTATMIVSLFNVPIISIQNAMGLHKLDSRFMFFQTISAIIVGYIFCHMYKMEGLLIGMLIPTIFFTLYNKGYLITNTVFGWSIYSYLFFLFKQVLILVIIVSPSVLISSYIVLDNTLITIFLKFVSSFSISFILFIIINQRNASYLALQSQLLNKFFKK